MNDPVAFYDIQVRTWTWKGRVSSRDEVLREQVLKTDCKSLDHSATPLPTSTTFIN